MDRTVDTPLRPLDGEGAPAEGRVTRPGIIAAVIGVLIAVSAAAGFLVTSFGPGDSLSGAERSVVALTTTLENGATVKGAGLILASSGEVVTSYNIVNGAVSIAADVSGIRTRYAATTFALDPTDGIAVLQLLDAKGLPSAILGSSSDIAVGAHVTAIGESASGSAATQSQGAVLALGQTTISAAPDGTASQTLSGLISFNAPLPGDGAGGPLVDTSGNVIGLDVASYPLTGASGAGFAIPIDRIMAIVHDVNTRTPTPDILQGHGAYLGIEVQNSTSPAGALVASVAPGTPAEIAGMTAGDVIVSIDGVGVDSVVALRDQLERYRGGEYITVGWLDSDQRRHSVTVQLASATFT
jgi:S1-C subfamily serine protease